MAAKLVRLKLPPKLLAHIKVSELHRHLQEEVTKLPYDLPSGDQDSLLNNLVFLLNSPLFLYTISSRLRSVAQNFRAPASHIRTTPEINVSSLSLMVGHTASSCCTQLRYGDTVLIEAGHMGLACQEECKKSLEWFCDEVEFLRHEYRAREEAAAEILGCELVRNVKSKVVRLRVGKQGLAALKKRETGGVKKEKKVKLKLRLWRDVVEGKLALV